MTATGRKADALGELYNARILRLATQIPFTARLERPQASVSRTSRICGSRLAMDANFDAEGRISELGLDVRACALGQAATALVAPKLIGLGREEIAPAARAFADMLDHDGVVPPPPWQELEIFLPVREHRARRGAVMLVFDAALAACDAASAAGGLSGPPGPDTGRLPASG